MAEQLPYELWVQCLKFACQDAPVLRGAVILSRMARTCKTIRAATEDRAFTAVKLGIKIRQLLRKHDPLIDSSSMYLCLRKEDRDALNILPQLKFYMIVQVDYRRLHVKICLPDTIEPNSLFKQASTSMDVTEDMQDIQTNIKAFMEAMPLGDIRVINTILTKGTKKIVKAILSPDQQKTGPGNNNRQNH